jgi:hypothetical protein
MIAVCCNIDGDGDLFDLGGVGGFAFEAEGLSNGDE